MKENKENFDDNGKKAHYNWTKYHEKQWLDQVGSFSNTREGLAHRTLCLKGYIKSFEDYPARNKVQKELLVYAKELLAEIEGITQNKKGGNK
jgi:hypothetical protein